MTYSEATGGRGKRRKAARDNAFNKNQADTKRALYHCNYCQKDISNVVRIKCAVCADFDLCLECFSVGVEITPHKSHHSYRVIDNLSFPLYHPEWGADEELLLLEAIEMYGLGNWGAVAEHVGMKNKEQCRQHYMQIYVEPPSMPEPTPSPEMAKFDVARFIEEMKRNPALKSPNRRIKAVRQYIQNGNLDAATPPPEEDPLQDATGVADGIKGEADDEAGASTPLPEEKPSTHAEDDHPRKAAKRPRHHAPEAEEPHSTKGGRSMHHGGAAEGEEALTSPRGAGRAMPTGGEVGPDGKGFCEVTGYNVKRQEFEHEYDNDAEVPLAEMEFTDKDTEAEREAKLRVLEIYNKRLDLREKRRAEVITAGLLSMKDLQVADRRRSGEKEMMAALRVFSRYLAPGSQEELAEGLLLEQRLRTRIQELQEARRQGIRLLVDAEELEAERRRKAGQEAGPSGAGAQAATGPIPLRWDKPPPMGAAAATPGTPAGTPGAALPSKNPQPALLAWRTKRGVQLDITNLPGVELLSARERDLCATTRLVPAHYLALKDTLLRDCEQHGPVTRPQARSFFRLDSSRSLRVYDLLLAAGWIGGPPSAAAATPGGAPVANGSAAPAVSTEDSGAVVEAVEGAAAAGDVE